LFIPILTYKYTRVTGAIVVLIAALVLCYVYNFYTKDFFIYSVLTACGAVLMYAAGLGKAQLTLFTIVKIVAGVLALAIAVVTAVLAFKASKNGGKLSIGKKNISLGKGFKYYPLFIGSAILFVGTVAALLFGAVTVYALCALFAAYLVIAIIYSIKMI